jgi:hypothetical protein
LLQIVISLSKLIIFYLIETDIMKKTAKELKFMRPFWSR